MKNDVECLRCGRILGEREEACAFRDLVVCRRCYEALSQPTVVPHELSVVHIAEPMERYRDLNEVDASRHPVVTGVGDRIFRFLHPSPGWICPQCGTLQEGHRRGSGGGCAVLLMVWVVAIALITFAPMILSPVFLLVAILFNIWYIAARTRRCISCDCRNCISVESPRGQELLRKI